jgi:long-chain acyl-CoA synthetase
MLTHGNFCANVASADGIVTCKPEWKFLSVLPMSHAYEFTICFLFPLKNGAQIIYAGKTPTPTVLEKICKAERPNVMGMVPMVMEKIYKKRVLPAIYKSKLLRAAMRFGFTRKRILQAAGKKLLTFFGGNLDLVAIGGASLNLDVETFLAEAKFPYIIGYGLTESAPLLCAGPLDDPTIALGSTGKPVPGVEIRIKDPEPVTGIGKIEARGANVMKGYFNNQEETAETIDKEGWLATGDLGFFDKHDNLHITGRSKSVIVLSHGENIYPEPIEEKINAYQHVVESLIIANGDRLEGWVYLDYELIDEETGGQNERQKHEYIAALLKRIQLEINPQLPPYSQISRFVERAEPFIKTATHKIKRYLYTQAG